MFTGCYCLSNFSYVLLFPLSITLDHGGFDLIGSRSMSGLIGYLQNELPDPKHHMFTPICVYAFLV